MRKLDYPSRIGNIYTIDEELTAIGVAGFVEIPVGVNADKSTTMVLTLFAGWKAHTRTERFIYTNAGS